MLMKRKVEGSSQRELAMGDVWLQVWVVVCDLWQ
jgi:hypothetical protein